MSRYSNKIKIFKYWIREQHEYLYVARQFNIESKQAVAKMVTKYKQSGCNNLIRNKERGCQKRKYMV